jgi:hypothetical protein
MINTIYERNINKATSVIVVTRYGKFEVCIMDYNAICTRCAMLCDEDIFLFDYVPLFEDATEAIAFVNANINNLI